MPAWLSIILALIGVLVPTGTLIVLAVRHGQAVQKVADLQEDVAEIRASMPTCQNERRRNESELHSRITEVAKTQAAHVARTDGLDGRVGRIEKKVFNGSSAHA
jgi:hypothetical protein